jgi:transcriptional regulator with XRE-family HTH domain
MSDRSNTDSDEQGTQEFLELIRQSQPGLEEEALWQALAKGAEHVDLSPDIHQEAVRRATLALAISRGELTLGKYLTGLRTAAHLSREAIAKTSKLSPDVIGEIETDRSRILSLQPERLAALAVILGALKAALLELVSGSASSQLTNHGLPRLTRMDPMSSTLSSERAVRRTQNRRTETDLEVYLQRLSSAYDAERARTRPT